VSGGTTSGRRGLAAGALLFLFAVGMRAAYVASVASEPSVRYPILDALAYHEWALAIEAGEWLGDRIYYQDPLYPFFLAGLYALFGAESVGVLLAQGVLDSASVVLLYATALRLFGFAPALATGVVASLYSVFLFYSALLLKAPLLLFLFNLAFYLLVRAAQGGGFSWWLASGAALGLGALTRGNALLFVPVLFAWIAFDRARAPRARLWNAAAVSAGIVLALAPVGLRNYVIGGELVVLNSQGGQNFYIGNFRGNGTGGYHPPPFLRADPRYEEEDFRRVAEQASGREMTPAEVSRYWWGRGLEEIGADPGHFLEHLGRKLLVLVNHHEIADNYSFDFVAEVGAPMLRWPLPSFGLLLPLAVCGAVFARRRRPTLLLLGFVLAYGASLLVFFNLSRLRLPIVPLVIAFGCFGLWEIGSRLRRLDLRASAPALVFLLVAYPVVYADLATDTLSIRHFNLGERHKAVSFEHQRRAVVFSKSGDEPAAREALRRVREERGQAERSYRRGLEVDPSNRRLRHGLRDLLVIRITNHQRLEEYEQAVAVAEELTREYPSHAPGYAWLGSGYARLGRFDEAERAFERALALDPRNQRARRELFLLKRRLGS
jgi:4-amino-4-deoxy-L-arabinose transferase-like glycosyltransferase